MNITNVTADIQDLAKDENEHKPIQDKNTQVLLMAVLYDWLPHGTLDGLDAIQRSISFRNVDLGLYELNRLFVALAAPQGTHICAAESLFHLPLSSL
ncbi:hypothetical protein J6590_009114 [Homalodisca vitripennis]|nr:hypothetical protein J6590_009114 [Homalodisca vitripennis]